MSNTKKTKGITKAIWVLFIGFLLTTSLFGQKTNKTETIHKENTINIEKHHSDSEMQDAFRADSFSKNLNKDTYTSLISLWPNRSLIIINHDTIIPNRGKQKKTPTVLVVGGMQMGFATLQRTNTTGISAEFPELNNGGTLHFGFNSEWGIKTFSGNWRLWGGIQYDIMNYRFNNNDIRLMANQPMFNTQTDSANNSAKSKIVVNYIGIPLSFGYQSKAKAADEGFGIRAGVLAGYRVRTHTKVKLDNEKTIKDFDDFNMNDFLITPFVQISYNNVGLYFRYNTSTLFKEQQGPKHTGLQFGLVFR
jgi:hypothetical protein